MEEILEEFQAFVDDLRTRQSAGALTGTDGERAQADADELVREYRKRLQAEESPVRGRELLERFKREAGRL